MIGTILNAAYVVLTLGILVYTIGMVRMMGRQLDEMRRQFEAQNRPYICFALESIRGGLLCLSIENAGNHPARNVRIRVNEGFVEKLGGVFQERWRSLTTATIFLPVKQKLYCSMGGPHDFSVLSEQTLSISVGYDGDGHHYEEDMEIPIKSYGWALTYESPLGDMANHVKKMSESLESIEKKLQ